MPKKYIASKLIKLILIFAICLLLVFLNPKNIFDPIRDFFLRISYPFQKTSYLISGKIRNFFIVLSSISDFKKENEKLIKENLDLSSQIAKLNDQEKENQFLRSQLDLLPRDKYELQASFVIGQNPDSSGNWIMVDKGENNGIKKGMPVIISEGILIGKIGEVFGNSSKVVLLSDSSSSVNAIDLETGAKGILSGEYGLSLVMGMVSQSDVLNVGDQVITSGLSEAMPRGFLIGKIQQAYNTQDKLFQQAIIVPKIKYSDLSTVFIVKGTI